MSGSSTASSTDAPVAYQQLPPRWTPSSARPRLPLGVAVVSVLIALLGLAMLLAGLLFLLGLLFGNAVPMVFEVFQSIDLYGAGILAIVGALLLGVATSLWRQETWALWTTIVLVFAATAYLFFTGSITVLFVLLVVLFVYLLAVRRYFY